MSILRRAAILAFSVTLFVLAGAIYLPHQGAWRNAPSWGDAPPDVRAAVMRQLAAFQDGYTRRDPQQVNAFADRLFSRQRPVALGTMPGEIRVGYDDVAALVSSDWESWGDCRFRIAEAEISAAGDVAWFALPGSVKFDLSRFLVLPLRLSGVMVNEQGAWRVRQLQFQFDLDLSALLLLNIVLLAWVAVDVIRLLAAVYGRIRARRAG